jgi:hypothetical protein
MRAVCRIEAATKQAGNARGSGANLPSAKDEPLVGGQTFESDRAARMEPPSGNTDFRAESDLAAIGKLA